jgi:prolyl oligopeptidase
VSAQRPHAALAARGLAAAGLAAWCLGAAVAGAQGAPPAPVRPVLDTLHGIVVADPYRWMEDERAPEVQAWYRAQSAHADSALARIPGRDALAAEIERLLGQDAGLWGLWPTARGVFTRRVPRGGDEPVLHVRERAGGADRVVVDPARLVFGGKRYAVRSTAPSPDGRHVALGIATEGDADPSLLVVDARTGALRERIGPVLWGSGDGFTAAWLPDGSGFLYTANDATPATPAAERWWRGRVWLHRVGSPRGADVAVFGHGLSDRVPLRPEWTPLVHTGAAAGHVAVRVWHGGPVHEVWTAPVAALDGARTPWRRVVPASEATEGVVVHGDGLLVITSDSAPRYRVVRHALGAGGTRTVLPEGEGVIVSMAPARDALYVVRRLGGGTRVVRVPWDGGPPRELALPFEGVARLATDPSRDGAYVRLLSWIQPDRAYRYDPATGTLALAGLEPTPRFDPSPYVVEATHAAARDGVRVPMTIVRRRDLPRDGARRVHLHGYGSFGSSVSTYFAPELKAWLDRGAIFAVAHVRGGGELGAAWHEAGRAARKPVAVADFVDAAEQLVRDGWTRAGRIGIEGASAGSYLVNNGILDRPDLFGAAVSAVGIGDAVRVYHTAGGPRNVQEVGSLDDASGVRSLLAVSALHRVRDGARYPPTLFVSGATDYVLPLWQTGKLVARLQAAQGSDARALWRIDWQGGHGGVSSNAVYARETALLYAFLLWRLGHPDFQPAGATNPQNVAP